MHLRSGACLYLSLSLFLESTTFILLLLGCQLSCLLRRHLLLSTNDFVGSKDTATAIGMEHIVIAQNILSSKVEQLLGIDEASQETCLEMQMRAIRPSRISTQSDGLTCAYHLIFLDQLFAHVSVQSLQSVGVTYDDILAISAALILHHAYLTIKGSTYGIAHIYLDIRTIMLSAETGTISEMAGHQPAVCGHVESTQIYAILLWELHTITAHIFVVPSGIQSRGRHLINLLLLQELHDRHAINSPQLTVYGSHAGQFVLGICPRGNCHESQKNQFCCFFQLFDIH